MSTCPQCRQPTKPKAKFCGRCGQTLAAPARPASTPPLPAATPTTVGATPAQPQPQRPLTLPRLIGLALLIYLLGAVGVVKVGQAVAAKPPTPAMAPVALAIPPREAGQKGLDWLLTAAVAWQEQQRCYGCHVQSFAIMGAAVAHGSDYTVNLAQTRQLTDYLASVQANEGYISSGQWSNPGVVVQSVLAGIGFSRYDEAVGAEYAPTLVKLADWLVTQQTDAGYWALDHQEAPIDQGEAMTTGAALSALAAAQRHSENLAYARAIQQGEAWLRRADLRTTQDFVFAVIGLNASGAANDDPDITRWIAMLKEQRNGDGGWGETTGLSSNGYATGQALYAYKLAGVGLAEESFTQGVLWLLNHQRPDGSWPQVHSQQQNGSRSSQYATTMWAVIGLGEIFDKATEAAFISLIHPTAATGAAPGSLALTTFLLLPLFVMLPLWWRRQGRRW
ncbi:MAG: hypothetical protein KF832_19005 [Caldilineaceae bacterium]|nr:hypothetical protein [Caldilineaceae bacterium]